VTDGPISTHIYQRDVDRLSASDWWGNVMWQEYQGMRGKVVMPATSSRSRQNAFKSILYVCNVF